MVPPLPQWLSTLKAAQLHRLAVQVGAPSSGTKTVLANGVWNHLHVDSLYRHPEPRLCTPSSKQNSKDCAKTSGRKNDDKLSLISIDMGIRNLAMSHMTAQWHLCEATGSYCYGKPTLKMWQRVSVMGMAPKTSKDTVAEEFSEDLRPINSVAIAAKESFEPSVWASRAYDLITKVISGHKPTNILIERQRYRSGGGSAVQEWTLRVGMFEAMLHAVLRSVVIQQNLKINVESVLPVRVNRYWLEDQRREIRESKGTKISGREAKKAKIELVAKLLAEASGSSSKLTVASSAENTAENFASTLVPKQRSKRGADTNAILKLDDLSDSLLQGLAWIDWQNNTWTLLERGADGSAKLLDKVND